MPETDPTQPEPTETPYADQSPPTNDGGQPADGGQGPVRHRLRTRPRGRTAYVVTGLVALLGLGVAGGATAVLGGGADDRTDLATVSADESARAAAADRADRAAREAAATPPPTPAPTAGTPTPSRSPAGKTARAGKSTAASKAPATRRAAAWVDPLPGAETTSCFGPRWGVQHAGIDLAMPTGTPIRAAGAGTVVEAGWAYTGYGISVVIDHGNGYLTHYAHQSRTAVGVGDRVTAGDVIGYEGATGDVTGPHLHFEVHNGLWNQIDPAPWMRARGVDLGC